MLENNIGCWWLETYTDLFLSSEGMDILEVTLSNISFSFFKTKIAFFPSNECKIVQILASGRHNLRSFLAANSTQIYFLVAHIRATRK